MLVSTLGFWFALAALQDAALGRLEAEVSAVLDPAGDARLLLLEDREGVKAPRTLRPGEAYADGWVLEALTSSAATLRRGADRRTVDFSARFGPDSTVAAEEIALSGPFAATNAEARWDPDNPNPLIRARLDRAIAAGDMAALARMGAEREDFATAAGVRAFGAGKAPLGSTAVVSFEGGTGVIATSHGRTVLVANAATRALPLLHTPPPFEDVFHDRDVLIIRGNVPADLELTPIE